MRRSGRVTDQLDYKHLHASGLKVTKQPIDVNELAGLFEDITLDERIMNNPAIEFETIIEDINDYIEEHQIHHDGVSLQEIDVLLNKVADYRSKFRMKYKELKQALSGYHEKFDELVNNKM